MAVRGFQKGLENGQNSGKSQGTGNFETEIEWQPLSG